MAAGVRITRAGGVWRDSLRAYKVVIDGQVVGSLRPGHTADFGVQPGVHGVQLTIDWCTSPRYVVRLADGAWAVFACRPSEFWKLWRVFVNVNEYIQLTPTPETIKALERQ